MNAMLCHRIAKVAMPIISTVRSSNLKSSLRFYIGVLDFERVEYDDD